MSTELVVSGQRDRSLRQNEEAFQAHYIDEVVIRMSNGAEYHFNGAVVRGAEVEIEIELWNPRYSDSRKILTLQIDFSGAVIQTPVVHADKGVRIIKGKALPKPKEIAHPHGMGVE